MRGQGRGDQMLRAMNMMPGQMDQNLLMRYDNNLRQKVLQNQQQNGFRG